MSTGLPKIKLRDLYHWREYVPSEISDKNSLALSAYADRMRISGIMSDQVERTRVLLKGILVRRKWVSHFARMAKRETNSGLETGQVG